MKKKSITLTAVIILFMFSFNNEAKCNEQKSFVNEVNSEALKSTKITPVLDTPISTDENLIYCSTFQMAWNELCNKYAMGTLEIEKAPCYVEKLNALYKQQPLLSEDSYLAMSGMGMEILKKINKTVQKKFGHLNKDELPPEFNFPLTPKDIVAFAYLYKNLEFEKPFEITKPILMKRNGICFSANTFGFDKTKYAKELKTQFQLLYIQRTNNSTSMEVVIKLTSKSETDEIIISTLPADKTMKESYCKIIKAINSKPGYIPEVASVQISKINFNILHEYKGLENKRLLNKSPEKYRIGKAVQKIALNLNEKGVKITSHEIIYLLGWPDSSVNVQIKCPFVIYFKDKTKDAPYFMAYVTNHELLSVEAMVNYDATQFPPLKPSERSSLWDLDEIPIYNAIQHNIKNKSDQVPNELLLALKTKTSSKSKGEKNELYKLIKDLIECGIEINSCDDSGLTPLMCAIEISDFEIVKLLIESGANIKDKNKDGKDALTIAKEKKNEEIIKLLSEKMKK